MDLLKRSTFKVKSKGCEYLEYISKLSKISCDKIFGQIFGFDWTPTPTESPSESAPGVI